jgi:hypothetical protein
VNHCVSKALVQFAGKNSLIAREDLTGINLSTVVRKRNRYIRFFFPLLDYFSQQEQDRMLQEFWEFDRKLIHEKYRSVVEYAEGAQAL